MMLMRERGEVKGVGPGQGAGQQGAGGRGQGAGGGDGAKPQRTFFRQAWAGRFAPNTHAPFSLLEGLPPAGASEAVGEAISEESEGYRRDRLKRLDSPVGA